MYHIMKYHIFICHIELYHVILGSTNTSNHYIVCVLAHIEYLISHFCTLYYIKSPCSYIYMTMRYVCMCHMGLCHVTIVPYKLA